jgi:hypothetical protein
MEPYELKERQKARNEVAKPYQRTKQHGITVGLVVPPYPRNQLRDCGRGDGEILEQHVYEYVDGWIWVGA